VARATITNKGVPIMSKGYTLTEVGESILDEKQAIEADLRKFDQALNEDTLAALRNRVEALESMLAFEKVAI
jgi:hypothetical protein